MSHVLARVSGFGWTIVPHFPFRFTRVEGDARALRVERGGAAPKTATIFLDSTEPRIQLSAGTGNVSDVCDLVPGAVPDAFRVETSIFTVGWPDSFDIVSGDQGGPSPFDFVGREAGLLYIQGPLQRSRVPALDAMAAPEQQIVDRGTHDGGAWIELAYEHDGQDYWMRHATIDWRDTTNLVVTGQSLAKHSPATRAAASFAIATLAPWRA